jgi:hypothetical protein
MPSDWARRRLQFRTLYRVFLLRVVDLELLSADGDPAKLIGQFTTIFVTISSFFTLPALLPLMGTASFPGTEGWTPQHFFIETTMTCAGLIAVLNWEAALPDKRDLLVLAPLPVRKSTLFLAKVAALFAAPALATVALNIFSGVVWPFLFRSGNGGFFGALRAWPAYWITVFVAGAFLVLAILTLQGLAANLLPRQLFLRFSAVLQSAVMCILLIVYFIEPSLESPAALATAQNQRLLAWLPSYWFLALFNELNGSMDPVLVPLAKRAWIGLGVSALGACTALLLCYFRLMRKMVEQPDILPQTRFVSWSPQFGNSLTGAITRFSMRTLLRSRQHRMILSFYLGLGITIVVGYVKATNRGFGSTGGTISNSFLFASILMMILTVLALRVVASIPISLSANWIIRVTQVRSARVYHRAIRWSWLTLGVTPVLISIAAFLLAASSPWRPALGHVCVMFWLGILLVEICLYTLRKIPFTCSYLPGKAGIHIAFWVSVLFFLRLLHEAAELEGRLLHGLLSSVMMIVIVALAAIGMRRLSASRSESTEALLFEEAYPAEVTSLGLN